MHGRPLAFFFLELHTHTLSLTNTQTHLAAAAGLEGDGPHAHQLHAQHVGFQQGSRRAEAVYVVEEYVCVVCLDVSVCVGGVAGWVEE